MNNNRQNFLDWMTKTIIDFCNAPDTGGPEDQARSWFLLRTGLPPNSEAAAWMDARLAEDIQLPVSNIPAWPPTGPAQSPTNGEQYVAAVAKAIDLFVARTDLNAEEKAIADWFTAFPPVRRGAGGTPTTSVPLPVRDWVRRSAPVASGTGELGMVSLELPLVKDGDGVIFIANKVADFRPVGLKADLAQLIVALDCAERVKGAAGRTLVKHVQQAMLELVQGALGGTAQTPVIEVVARGKQPAPIR